MIQHPRKELTVDSKSYRKFAKKSNSTKPKVFKKKPEFDIAKCISDANTILSTVKDQISELKLPSFGSSLCDRDSVSCVYTPDTTIASLVADRYLNKFESPNHGTEQLLRDACTMDWLNFEENHLRKFRDGPLRDSVGARSTVYKAAGLIEQWLNPLNYSESFWYHVSEAPIEFGPGETFKSSNGNVSIQSKLFSLDDWTTTEDNAPMAAMVIAANYGFRRLIVQWLKTRTDRTTYDKRQREAYKACVNEVSRVPLKIRVLAYRAYHEFLYEHDIDSKRSRIIRGSRASSVYKNITKRRPINIEGLFNVIVQKIIGYALRTCLKQNAKIDLDLGQDKHRKMLADMSLSTADFSNASESITVWLVRTLFSRVKKIFKVLDSARSKFCIHNYPFVTPNHKVEKSPLWVPNEKFSSMGNGFTFEILTLVIASIARVTDCNASVYGDDLICSTVSADKILSDLTAVGFVPNMKKTFIGVPFRESCGGFYLHEYGYITSFDIKWCTSIPDIVVTSNKLRRIVDGNPNWNHPLRDLLERAHADVLALLPATFRGPIVSGNDLPLWAESNSYMRSHMNSTAAITQWRKFESVADQLCEQWQYFHKGDITNWFSTYGWVVVNVYTQIDEAEWPVKDVLGKNDLHLHMSYLHAGMRTPGLRRLKDNDLKYRKINLLVTPEGDFIKLT